MYPLFYVLKCAYEKTVVVELNITLMKQMYFILFVARLVKNKGYFLS